MAKLSKIIASKFSSREWILDVRLKTAKIFFVFAVLLFSLNYFFVGAWFYESVLTQTLPYSYIVFVISFVFLAHLMIVKKFLVKKHISFSLVLLFVLLLMAGAIIASLFL